MCQKAPALRNGTAPDTLTAGTRTSCLGGKRAENGPRWEVRSEQHTEAFYLIAFRTARLAMTKTVTILRDDILSSFKHMPPWNAIFFLCIALTYVLLPTYTAASSALEGKRHATNQGVLSNYKWGDPQPTAAPTKDAASFLSEMEEAVRFSCHVWAALTSDWLQLARLQQLQWLYVLWAMVGHSGLLRQSFF